MLKYYLNLVRIWYQNPSIFLPNSIQKALRKLASFFVTIFVSKIYQNLSIFDQNSMPKLHLKETSSFDADSVSKVFQNEVEKPSKMLGRNCATPPWGHFGQIKPGSWSQGHLQGPSSCSFWRHMDLIWTQFSSCSTCSYIISRAAFVCKVQFTVRIKMFTVHNLQIRAHPCNHRSSFNSHRHRTPLTRHCSRLRM